MIDLTDIIKNSVSSVCRTAEFIYVVIANDTIIVDAADTTLSIIPIGFETGLYSGFMYPGDYTVNNPDIFRYVMSKWELYDNLSRVSPVEGEISDLREDTKYESLLSRKADDGAGRYLIPGNELNQSFLLFVFTGMPILNKQDRIGIVVKRIDYGTLLMEYHIYKKKINKNIVLYFRTSDMNRKLLDEQFKVRN
jgi:hypothetical protein